MKLNEKFNEQPDGLLNSSLLCSLEIRTFPSFGRQDSRNSILGGELKISHWREHYIICNATQLSNLR